MDKHGRYIVRIEGDPNRSEQSFVCQTCAVESIPVGESRLVTDAWSGLHWRMWRQTETTGYAFPVWLDSRKRVVRVSGDQLALVIDQAAHQNHKPTTPIPVRVGRGSDDWVREPATVASVERFLKGGGAR